MLPSSRKIQKGCTQLLIVFVVVMVGIISLPYIYIAIAGFAIHIRTREVPYLRPPQDKAITLAKKYLIEQNSETQQFQVWEQYVKPADEVKYPGCYQVTIVYRKLNKHEISVLAYKKYIVNPKTEEVLPIKTQ